jgi:hypothetical protein
MPFRPASGRRCKSRRPRTPATRHNEQGGFPRRPTFLGLKAIVAIKGKQFRSRAERPPGDLFEAIMANVARKIDAGHRMVSP